MATIADETKEKMNGTLEHFKVELKTIRTGRANTGMLDGVMVEVYGSPTRLKEVASINAPEARQLVVTPFDPKNVNVIAKAIEKANLGVSPIADGNVVRIKIPPMDEAKRKEMVKIIHKMCEEAKVKIRNIRRDMNEKARKQKQEWILPEDQLKKIEKTIQEHTDKFCSLADEATVQKEKEIMTV